MPRKLIIDVETESTEDVTKLGAYAYCNHPSTEGMCISWRYSDEVVGEERKWRINELGNAMPKELLESLESDDEWWAFNAFFERCFFSLIGSGKYGWREVPFEKWHCAAALAAYYGYPQQLERCCEAMHLSVVKDMDGSALMMKMHNPKKRKKKIKEDWENSLDKLGSYCATDVAATCEIINTLPPYPESEREIWLLDQRINWRGIPLDRLLIEAAARINEVIQADARERLPVLTNGYVETPGQVKKIREWLLDKFGIATRNLKAATVKTLLDDEWINPVVEEVLQIRQDSGTAAIKKFKRELAVILFDSECRFRGGYLHNGAHTGRWTGKLIQPTNMPRMHFNSDAEVEAAVEAIVSRVLKSIRAVDATSLHSAKVEKLARGGTWDEKVDGWRPSVTNTLTKCVRASVKAPEGKQFVANDWCGIELRVLLWFVGDKKGIARIIEKGSSQLYLDMAEKIFGCKVDKSDTFRYTTGKAAMLGCGYGMGSFTKDPVDRKTPLLDADGNPGGGLINYAKGYGINISTELADRTIKLYREENPLVRRSWGHLQDRFISALRDGITSTYNGCRFERVKMCGDTAVSIRLPSGRKLWYPGARLTGSSRRPRIVYKRYKDKKWIDKYTYGGSILENIIQGMSRDILTPAMLAIDPVYPIFAHCYDEVGCEVDEFEVEECDEFMAEKMCERQWWCEELPLEVEGWIGPRYKK